MGGEGKREERRKKEIFYFSQTHPLFEPEKLSSLVESCVMLSSICSFYIRFTCIHVCTHVHMYAHIHVCMYYI